jgi:chaperonin GroES
MPPMNRRVQSLVEISPARRAVPGSHAAAARKEEKETESEENIMKLRPLADRVIVKQSDAEEKTASGILLPDTAKEKPTKGKVISVGPGKLDDKGKPMELSIRKGDTVFYGKYSGTDIEVDGEKFVILRESDILGVLE